MPTIQTESVTFHERDPITLRRFTDITLDGSTVECTASEKHCAYRTFLRQVFQCEIAVHFQVKPSAASMD